MTLADSLGVVLEGVYADEAALHRNLARLRSTT